MTQVFVFNNWHAKPGNEEAVVSAVRLMAARVRTEPGCIFMRVYQSVNRVGHVIVHSCWEDRETLDDFVRLPYVAQFLDDLAPLTEHPLDVSVTHEIV